MQPTMSRLDTTPADGGSNRPHHRPGKSGITAKFTDSRPSRPDRGAGKFDSSSPRAALSPDGARFPHLDNAARALRPACADSNRYELSGRLDRPIRHVLSLSGRRDDASSVPDRDGCLAFANGFCFACRFLWSLMIAAVLVSARSSFAGDGIEQLLQETHWGESSGELRSQFGDAARGLPHVLDFGDSYVDTVLTHQTLGGVPMVVFLQMDKATRGLKRIQLERPRHGVNPPSFRAVTAALHADYGKPDQTCVIPVLPASGYQAAAEEKWARVGAVISAIFRDTTLQAFEGCLFGPATGWCGLRGQILVRIGPPDDGAGPCSLAVRFGLGAAMSSTDTRP